jgi:hypothetical protein
MLVIAGVPDILLRDRLCCEGVSPLDELNALWKRLIYCWCDEQMDVVGHDGEGVQLKLALFAIAKKSFEEEIGIGFILEVAMLKECGDADGVGAALRGGHGGKHTLGLKPLFLSMAYETRG